MLRAQARRCSTVNQNTAGAPLPAHLAVLLGRAGSKGFAGSSFFGWGLGSNPPGLPETSACLIDKGKKNRNGRTYLQPHRRLGAGVNEYPPPHLPWGHSSAAVGFVSHSNHIAARWGKVSDGTATIFAPSHTLTLQAQRFLLSASARSLFVTALERLNQRSVCDVYVRRVRGWMVGRVGRMVGG